MNEKECDVRPEDIQRFVDEYNGGRDVAVQILTMLMEDVPFRVERIRAAYEAGDFSAAAEVTHSLISSIGVLGNACQTETARDLETELRGPQATAANRSESVSDRGMARFEGEMADLLSAIDAVLSTDSASSD